jgi:hypothetical protein
VQFKYFIKNSIHCDNPNIFHSGGDAVGGNDMLDDDHVVDDSTCVLGGNFYDDIKVLYLNRPLRFIVYTYFIEKMCLECFDAIVLVKVFTIFFIFSCLLIVVARI